MGEPSRRIKSALLRAAVDLGHGGPLSEYRVDSGEDGYTVTLRISGPPGGPGRAPAPPQPPSQPPRPLQTPAESLPDPRHLTEVLPKESAEVEEFLRKLSADFDVYALADLRWSYPFLHPTFYSFGFLDDAGESHGFEYRIECSNHLDERYQRLVREFEEFFESRRVFAKFFGGGR